MNHLIYIKDMEHALLCLNQYREYDTVINKIPHHLDHTGTGRFTITAGDYDFPLEQYGPMAYIYLRRLS